MEGPVFVENISEQFALTSQLSAVYHKGKSKFQTIDVVETTPWGRCLILDGHMQSTERDEFVYHENLVHPVMLSHPNPKRVFVGGGGEGATVRELLRYKCVDRVVMVDIDEECVLTCKQFLTKHHQGSFDDARLELVIDDAKAYLEKTQEKFDLIILDLADPVEGGPAKLLYTQKFYEMAKTKLADGGFFVTQGGPAGVLSCDQVFTAINRTLTTVFPVVVCWGALIPSFADHWGFLVAATKKDYDITSFSKQEIDKRIEERIKGGGAVLKYYDGHIHAGMFQLPKIIRKALAEETRIITEETLLVIP